MNRINITGEDGKLIGWFDLGQAEVITGLRRAYDGANRADVHTHDANGGQNLIHTAGGRWILEEWSNWQGARDHYTYLSTDAARDWLIVNEASDEEIERLTGERIAPERGPGRPAVGPTVRVRMPQEMIDWIDDEAEQRGVDRSEMIRRIIIDWPDWLHD